GRDYHDSRVARPARFEISAGGHVDHREPGIEAPGGPCGGGHGVDGQAVSSGQTVGGDRQGAAVRKRGREGEDSMELDLSRFRETFFQEAAEHLDTMEAALLSLRAGQSDCETLNAIFRCAHSIKAGAATFGFEATTRFTHVLESLLDRMRNGE